MAEQSPPQTPQQETQAKPPEVARPKSYAQQLKEAARKLNPRDLLKKMKGDGDFPDFDSGLTAVTEARRRVALAVTSGNEFSPKDLSFIEKNAGNVLSGLDSPETFAKASAEIISIQSLGFILEDRTVPVLYADKLCGKLDIVRAALHDPQLSASSLALLTKTADLVSDSGRGKFEAVILSEMGTFKDLMSGEHTNLVLSMLEYFSIKAHPDGDLSKSVDQFLNTEAVDIISKKIDEDNVPQSMKYLNFVLTRKALNGRESEAIDDLPKYAGLITKAIGELGEIPVTAGMLLTAYPDNPGSREVCTALMTRFTEKKDMGVIDILGDVSLSLELGKEVGAFFEHETDAILEYFKTEKKGSSAISRIISGENQDQVRKIIGGIKAGLDGGDMDYFKLIPDVFTRGAFGEDFLALCVDHVDLLKKGYSETDSDSQKRSFEHMMGSIAVWGGKEQAKPVVDFVFETLRVDSATFFETNGLDKDRMIEAWRHGSVFTFKNFERNIQSIKKLEEVCPGAAKVLERDFGIKNFGRYPVDMLVRQYSERDDSTKQYGILLTAEFDHGDALGGESSIEIRKDLLEHLPEGLGVRVTEASSVMDIARNFSRMKQRYGQAVFGFIHAHGSEDVIGLGRNREDIIHVDSLATPQAQRIMEVFKPGAPIILPACGTGSLEGPAQEISNLGFRVCAPDFISSGISSIEISGEANRPQFATQFKDVMGKVRPGRVFENGRLSA